MASLPLVSSSLALHADACFKKCLKLCVCVCVWTSCVFSRASSAGSRQQPGAFFARWGQSSQSALRVLQNLTKTITSSSTGMAFSPIQGVNVTRAPLAPAGNALELLVLPHDALLYGFLLLTPS